MSLDNGSPCPLCPRRCPDRSNGLCGEVDFARARVAKTMLHPWEEPPVSGARGTGAVFFAGCNLRCVFCQNHKISQARPLPGETLDAPRLAELFWRLKDDGAESVSLISPTHALPVAREAMRLAKGQSFPLPFVWNSNAYENPEALRTLAGLVGLYLPDLKYCDGAMALRYSSAPDYFTYAAAAIQEMRRQTGVLIRHMVLPGGRRDSMRVLDWIAANAPDARVSLLAQYTPMHRAAGYPPLHRRLTAFEYDSVAEHALSLGLQGYFQGRGAATAEYTPAF
jgi:putative pyruvate formate lyase activating enzyme